MTIYKMTTEDLEWLKRQPTGKIKDTITKNLSFCGSLPIYPELKEELETAVTSIPSIPSGLLSALRS